ncbi:hypothetical protein E4U57_007239 [Claviceps arundinis]|uniref:Helicase ATP-binding domain-containing protein n=1 Tax=Claviceps arundinis TaxID=1623583 RepID=A0ABQ7P165_9HYPO|nr:hypothetical protein E4U57_007239 [Claviceps arundinis]
MNNADPALVVVLPTGGGKSLLFTAPAGLENSGMTIVVVPYRQLITETVNDAVARGIESMEWTPLLQAPMDLVVVSADNLTDLFFLYTMLMTEKGWLRRVFLDECHLAITAHSWRPNLIRLPKLRSISAPTIMLTATLPLHMKREFKETMLLVQDPCWLIRASTARKSTRYMVKFTVADGKLIEEATKVCKEQMDVLQPEAKMIVFCRYKDQCVNYKDVALTVHVGMPYGLIDFAQESGRAGRDGEAVALFILLSAGEKLDCISGDMERCDRCCSGVSDWTRSQKEMSVERDMVENVLNQIAVVCPVCWVTLALGFGPETGRARTQRETVNCTSSTGGTLNMSALECDIFRASILDVKDANACHRCGISQKLCNTREAGSQCQWPRIAPAILRLATANDAGREIITKAGYIGEMND